MALAVRSTREPRSTPSRRVSLAEAVTFTAVLGVPPSSLYLPLFDDDDVQLTPDLVVDVGTAHRWARGDQPLDPDNERFYRFQSYRARKEPVRKATVEDYRRAGIELVHVDEQKEQ